MSNEKCQLANLAIELTRRCNLRCEHCLRGDAQERDINAHTIDLLFKQISYVNSLTLTGGEPSLCPDLIKQVVDSCYYYDVAVDNFYIATNGITHKDYSDFMAQVIRLWYYCSDNEISSVHISNGLYHRDAASANPVNFENHPLKAFRFCEIPKPRYKYLPQLILKQGRADKIPGAREIVLDYIQRPEDYSSIEGLVYINVHDDIIEGCDWSYTNQPKHSLGNLYKIGLSEALERRILENKQRYNSFLV